MMTDEQPTTDNPQASALYRLVQAKFDAKQLGSVSDWIDAQRAAGRSWAGISYELRDLVSVDVSYETLRRWAGGTVADET